MHMSIDAYEQSPDSHCVDCNKIGKFSKVKASYSDKGIYRNHNLNSHPTRLKLTCVYEIDEVEEEGVKKGGGVE
jgi:hypothetical protein